MVNGFRHEAASGSVLDLVTEIRYGTCRQAWQLRCRTRSLQPWLAGHRTHEQQPGNKFGLSQPKACSLDSGPPYRSQQGRLPCSSTPRYPASPTDPRELPHTDL